MKKQFEYTIKWSNVGKGTVTRDRGHALRIINQILLDREVGMGAGKVIITQRRVTEEAGA